MNLFWRRGVLFLLIVLGGILASPLVAAVANFSVNVTEVVTTPTRVSQNQTGIVVDVKITNRGALGTDSENVNITNVTLFFFVNSNTSFNVSSNYTFSLQNTTPIIINGSAVGGNTTYVRFLVNVSNTAETGSITLNASVGASNETISNSGANTTDVEFRFGDSWTSQTKASIAIDKFFGIPARVSQNQTFYANVSINNTGGAIANISVKTADLRFFSGSIDVTSNYSVSAVTGPTVINGSGNQSNFTFTIQANINANVSSGLTLTIANGQPDANDSNSNQNITDANGPAVNGSTIVQTRASIAIDRVFGTPPTVSQNQTFQVNVSINNTGETIANVTVNTADLRFFIGATDVTSNYTVNNVAGPTLINGSNNQSFYNFSVTASNSANAGSLIITYATGFPLANDSLSNQNVTDPNGPAVNATLTLQTKAALAIDKFFGIPARVSQNMTFYTNLSINNTGGAIANVSSNMTSDLRFFIGATDVTSNYTVSRVTGPSIVNGSGNQSNLTFQILTSINANTGSLIITVASGFPAANDSNSNENVTDSNGPAVNGSTIVQTRASIALDRIRAPTANVSQNQTFQVNVTINNTGETIANITVNTVDLRFFIGATDVTTNYSVSAVSGPTLVNGSYNQSNYTFTVAVLNNANNGTVTVTYATGFPLANDSLSNQNVTDPNGPAVNGTLYVQQAANLSITQITGSPFTLGTGSTTIFVGITNIGEAIADVSNGSNVTNESLVFRMNQTTTIITGLNVTRNDSVTTVAGGATATLTFVVTRNTATYDGNVTVNATLTYNDTNLNTISINSPAIRGNDTTFILDNTAPLLAGGGPISPTVDKSKATFEFTTDTAATCRYNVDLDKDFSGMTKFDTTGGTTHKTLLVLDNGVHRVYIRCRDGVDNERLTVSSFFDITKGGGSGGAGQGGSSSSSAASVSAGESTTIVFSESDATGVSAITITPNSDVKNVRVTVSKLFVPPASPAISEEQGHVYKYVLINKINLEDSNLKEAKVRFEVEKAWLQEKAVPADTVALRRLETEGWKELPTRKVEETETHVVYEATTPGFSTFAITAGYKELPSEETSPVSPEPQKPGTPVKDASPSKQQKAPLVPTGETVGAPYTTPPALAKKAGLWPVAGIIALLLLIIISFVYVRRSRKKPF